jgi:hypothetical protein
MSCLHVMQCSAGTVLHDAACLPTCSGLSSDISACTANMQESVHALDIIVCEVAPDTVEPQGGGIAGAQLSPSSSSVRDSKGGGIAGALLNPSSSSVRDSKGGGIAGALLNPSSSSVRDSKGGGIAGAVLNPSSSSVRNSKGGGDCIEGGGVTALACRSASLVPADAPGPLSETCMHKQDRQLS